MAEDGRHVITIILKYLYKCFMIKDLEARGIEPLSLSQYFGDFVPFEYRRQAYIFFGVMHWRVSVSCMCPAALTADPTLAAIDATGRRMERIDWYVGIPPTRRIPVAAKLHEIESAVRFLEPDAIHLGFTRWPGFWELWMPDRRREDFPEYSYDLESLQQFQAETGRDLPSSDAAAAASFIATKASDVWVDWKCRVVVDAIRQIKETARRFRPGIEVVLNTVPFDKLLFRGEGALCG
jgi:hypothetical protein